MRLVLLSVCGGLLAACTSGPVTVPSDRILYEVPRQQPTAARPATMAPVVSQAPAVSQVPRAAPPEDFTRRIERVLADEPAPGAAPAAPVAAAAAAPVAPVPVPPARDDAAVAQASPLDDDRLNLNEYTLEQQRIDAAIAERELEAARQQLVIVEPGASVPQAPGGVNIALFAKQTTHAVGERRYSRPVTAVLNRGGACRRFSSPDEAQRFFLANGGPERDPHGLDPEGDGFACGWDPEPYRRLGQL